MDTNTCTRKHKMRHACVVYRCLQTRIHIIHTNKLTKKCNTRAWFHCLQMLAGVIHIHMYRWRGCHTYANTQTRQGCDSLPTDACRSLRHAYRRMCARCKGGLNVGTNAVACVVILIHGLGRSRFACNFAKWERHPTQGSIFLNEARNTICVRQQIELLLISSPSGCLKVSGGQDRMLIRMPQRQVSTEKQRFQPELAEHHKTISKPDFSEQKQPTRKIKNAMGNVSGAFSFSRHLSQLSLSPSLI